MCVDRRYSRRKLLEVVLLIDVPTFTVFLSIGFFMSSIVNIVGFAIRSVVKIFQAST